MKPKFLTVISVGVAALCALRMLAQTYSIDWHTVDGGGGSSTGAVYSVSGTIGQPDAGRMGSASYSIDGGFWGILAVVQTAGAPLLTIQRTNSSEVILSWPAPSAGFVLQENATPATTGWLDVTNQASVAGAMKQVLVSPAMGNRFYRLKK